MEAKVLDLIGKAMNISTKDLEISKCNSNELEEWDSLNILNLIVLIEEEFKIELDEDEAISIMDGGIKIIEVIQNKL